MQQTAKKRKKTKVGKYVRPDFNPHMATQDLRKNDKGKSKSETDDKGTEFTEHELTPRALGMTSSLAVPHSETRDERELEWAPQAVLPQRQCL